MQLLSITFVRMENQPWHWILALIRVPTMGQRRVIMPKGNQMVHCPSETALLIWLLRISFRYFTEVFRAYLMPLGKNLKQREEPLVQHLLSSNKGYGSRPIFISGRHCAWSTKKRERSLFIRRFLCCSRSWVSILCKVAFFCATKREV